MLHSNELPLRHLIEALVGKSDSKSGFSGPIGKLFKKVHSMQRKSVFKKIDLGPGLIDLPDEVLSDLSTE